MQTHSGNTTTRVGAVIWAPAHGDARILVRGANRFPAPFASTPARRRQHFSDFDLHAESDALSVAARRGLAVKGMEITATHCPCPECAALIAEAGLSHVSIDGSQKMRPNFVANWLPTKQRGLDLLANAGIDVSVVDLRLKDDGAPDLTMTPAEADDSLRKGYCLSRSETVVADPAEGTRRFREAVSRSAVSKKPAPADPWLASRHDIRTLLTRSAPSEIEAVIREVDIAMVRRSLDRSPFPSHAAVFIGAGGAPHRFEYARPPVGSEHRPGTREESLAASLHPEMLLVAHAARDGVRMAGGSVYVSHFPVNRSAVMLAGAGIGKLYVDGRNLPQKLDAATADRLWKSHVMLAEAGIETVFVGRMSEREFFTRVEAAASPETIEAVRPHPEEMRVEFADRLAERKRLSAPGGIGR